MLAGLPGHSLDTRLLPVQSCEHRGHLVNISPHPPKAHIFKTLVVMLFEASLRHLTP